MRKLADTPIWLRLTGAIWLYAGDWLDGHDCLGKKIKNSIVSVKQKKSSSPPIKNWILESARICYDTLGFDKPQPIK